jgi:hypothetical protein
MCYCRHIVVGIKVLRTDWPIYDLPWGADAFCVDTGGVS